MHFPGLGNDLDAYGNGPLITEPPKIKAAYNLSVCHIDIHTQDMSMNIYMSAFLMVVV